MKLARKLTAPVSAIFLLLVAVFAFVNLQTKSAYPPPILDPQFDLWVPDRDFGGRRPMGWDLEYVKGAGDQVALQETVLAGRKALEIKIFQDGVDDEWAYVYLRQMITGTRLSALFSVQLGVWIFSEPSCGCKDEPPSQSTVFGIETNDGVHTLNFVFSTVTTEPQQFLGHRTVFLQTAAGEWTHHRIDLYKEYKEAHWTLPERLSFSIVLGAPGPAKGLHVGYVHGFSWTEKTTVSSTSGHSVEPALSSQTDSDVIWIGDHRACMRQSEQI